MGKISKLRALVIDSERERSRQLKYMLSQVHGYKHISIAKTFSDALTQCNEDEDGFNIFILSVEQGEEEIRSFIDSVQSEVNGKPTVFFAILRNTDGELSSEETLLLGIHGYVETPFSIDQLQERTQTAIEELDKLRIERAHNVIRDVIGSSCTTIDNLSLFLKSGLGAGSMVKSLREQRKVIGRLDPEFLPFLYDTIVNTYTERELPTEENLPPNLSREDKKTLQNKIAELKETWSFERSQQGKSFCIKAHGDVNTPRAVAYLEKIIGQVSRQELTSLTLDFSDAVNMGNSMVALAIKQMKSLKKNQQTLHVTGDAGKVKSMIQKIIAKKQQAAST